MIVAVVWMDMEAEWSREAAEAASAQMVEVDDAEIDELQQVLREAAAAARARARSEGALNEEEANLALPLSPRVATNARLARAENERLRIPH